jgi:hypothetical protein
MIWAYNQKKTPMNKVIAPACRLARPRARVVIIVAVHGIHHSATQADQPAPTTWYPFR